MMLAKSAVNDKTECGMELLLSTGLHPTKWDARDDYTWSSCCMRHGLQLTTGRLTIIKYWKYYEATEEKTNAENCINGANVCSDRLIQCSVDADAM